MSQRMNGGNSNMAVTGVICLIGGAVTLFNGCRMAAVDWSLVPEAKIGTFVTGGLAVVLLAAGMILLTRDGRR